MHSSTNTERAAVGRILPPIYAAITVKHGRCPPVSGWGTCAVLVSRGAKNKMPPPRWIRRCPSAGQPPPAGTKFTTQALQHPSRPQELRRQGLLPHPQPKRETSKLLGTDLYCRVTDVTLFSSLDQQAHQTINGSVAENLISAPFNGDRPPPMAPCRPSRRRFRRAAAQVLGLGSVALAAGAGLFPPRHSAGSTPAFLHRSCAGTPLRPSSPAAATRQPGAAGWERRRGRSGQAGAGWDGVFGQGGAKKLEGPSHAAVSVLLHDEPVRESCCWKRIGLAGTNCRCWGSFDFESRATP